MFLRMKADASWRYSLRNCASPPAIDSNYLPPMCRRYSLSLEPPFKPTGKKVMTSSLRTGRSSFESWNNERALLEEDSKAKTTQLLKGDSQVVPEPSNRLSADAYRNTMEKVRDYLEGPTALERTAFLKNNPLASYEQKNANPIEVPTPPKAVGKFDTLVKCDFVLVKPSPYPHAGQKWKLNVEKKFTGRQKEFTGRQKELIGRQKEHGEAPKEASQWIERNGVFYFTGDSPSPPPSTSSMAPTGTSQQTPKQEQPKRGTPAVYDLNGRRIVHANSSTKTAQQERPSPAKADRTTKLPGADKHVQGKPKWTTKGPTPRSTLTSHHLQYDSPKRHTSLAVGQRSQPIHHQNDPETRIPHAKAANGPTSRLLKAKVIPTSDTSTSTATLKNNKQGQINRPKNGPTFV